MDTERIKEIQQATAYPQSVSVQQAVWNETEQNQLHIGTVNASGVFEHYGKPFTNGRDLWDFLTTHYNFIPKT